MGYECNPQIFLSYFCSLNLVLIVSPPVRLRRHIVLTSASVCLSDCKSQKPIFINLLSYLFTCHAFSDIWTF